MFFTIYFNDTHSNICIVSLPLFNYQKEELFIKELFITSLHFNNFHPFILHDTRLLRTHFIFCNDSGKSSMFMFVLYFSGT